MNGTMNGQERDASGELGAWPSRALREKGLDDREGLLSEGADRRERRELVRAFGGGSLAERGKQRGRRGSTLTERESALTKRASLLTERAEKLTMRASRLHQRGFAVDERDATMALRGLRLA